MMSISFSWVFAVLEDPNKHIMLTWMKEIKSETNSEDESEDITYSKVATNAFIEKGYDKER